VTTQMCTYKSRLTISCTLQKPKGLQKTHKAVSFSSLGTLFIVKLSIMTVVWMRRRVLKACLANMVQMRLWNRCSREVGPYIVVEVAAF